MNSVLKALMRRAPQRLLFQHRKSERVPSFHQFAFLRKGDEVNVNNSAELVIHERATDDVKYVNAATAALTGSNEVKSKHIPYTDICAIQPTLSLVQHVNTSEVLSELVKLGVSIHKIDKTPGVRDWILKLNMEHNVKPLIKFFLDQNISIDCVGDLINKCPHILQLSSFQFEKFTVYLQSKNFTPEMITKILTKSPHLLIKSIEKMDFHLGMLQKTFNLSGEELRMIVSREPRLVSLKKEELEERNFALKEEMGFDKFQLKQLIIAKPRLWLLNSSSLSNRFNYIHNIMGLSHEVIVSFPAVLTCREFKLRARHQFLQFLGRAQYDPTVPLYVNPLQIIRDSDASFAVSVAKSNADTFVDFCKTL